MYKYVYEEGEEKALNRQIELHVRKHMREHLAKDHDGGKKEK